MAKRKEIVEIEEAACAVERLSFGLLVVIGVTGLYGILIALEGRWEGVYKYCFVCVLAVLFAQCANWVGHWVKVQELEKRGVTVVPCDGQRSRELCLTWALPVEMREKEVDQTVMLFRNPAPHPPPAPAQTDIAFDQVAAHYTSPTGAVASLSHPPTTSPLLGSTKRSNSSSSGSDRSRTSQVSEDRLIADAASVASAGRYSEARRRLEKEVKRRKPAATAKLHDRFLLALSDEASTLHKGPEQEKLLRKGLAGAVKARDSWPQSAVGYTWYAAFCGRLNSYKSLREKLADSEKIREAAVKALRLDGNNALAHHVLGVWCYNVAKVGWIERHAASAFLGDLPTSTFNDSLHHLQRANGIYPFFENSVAIADCFRELQRVQEAKSWYRSALSQLSGPKDKDHFRQKVHKKMSSL
ncbi:Regulator of microtubule dynamics protein 1 [Diplonema papillatum]|nr:Regulator of microtubule dynamics protein 1 [Diplonema papillatum]|eukprot:gene883-1360_t